jgi:RND family efflux transporter MFP subunit
MKVTKLFGKTDTTNNTSPSFNETTPVANTNTNTKKKPVIGILQILAVIVLMALAFIYSREPDKAADAPPVQNESFGAAPLAPLVSVLQPTITSGQIDVSSTGSVAVRSYVTLASQVSGRVVATSPSLRSGGRFSAGETLVSLEQKDFTLALAQVEADVRSAQATLELSQAEASAAIANYKILNPKGDVPPLVAKAPQVAQAQAQLQAAIARRDIQQVNLDRSVFSLPFSGRVVESSADEGQILSAGQSFGRVYANDAVEVVITLAPEDIAKLSPLENRVATITADGVAFEGRIDRVAAERDMRSRFSQVFLTTASNLPLIPGTFVSVKLSGSPIANTILLPETALQVGQSVWVVQNDVISKVSANVLGRSNGKVLVEAFDYAEGVVIGSVPGARNGLAVRVVEAK